MRSAYARIREKTTLRGSVGAAVTIPEWQGARVTGMTRRRIAPRTLALLAAFVLVGGVAIALQVVAPPSTAYANLGVALLMIPFAAVGLLIVNRKPENAIGWILVAMALLTTVGLDAAVYSVMANREHYHLPLARLGTAFAASWVPVLVLIPAPLALFPDGRIPRGRWRRIFWGYLALAILFTVDLAITDLGSFTEHPLRIATTGELAALSSNSSTLAALLNDFAGAAYAAISLAIVCYQVVEFRRSTGDEHQQRKWFLAGGAVGLGSVVLASLFNPLSFLFPLLIALPIGMGIGILKYRLYDIDRLISRTISYAILTALLAGVFVGIVVVATDVLPLSSPVAVAASTLAAAALFNPLRVRTQRLIDRRFNRARYDAQATVAAFSGRLRNAIDPESINHELLRVVDRTIAPAHASLWIRPQASARDGRRPA